MPILKWSSLFFAFITLSIAASAQQQIAASADARQTVGIAFSGGSALGLAHIGVIRYFEERHIPIDDVAGTSMGGLIGGLYATGMDSSQITDVVKHADWNALLNPSPPFADQPIVDKQNWSRTFGDFTLRFGRGFSLPSGLNPGEALSLLLSRSTLAYSSVTDFDQLPTPFRCVATDLVSGDAIVLSKGSLPIAMRATMSLPGIFTPVKIGQMVLVDGGVLENIPVDEARKMGAQTVIAIAFEMPKPKPEQFKSLTDVLRQTVSLAIVKNEQRSLANADLVIAIDTKNFGATDYPRWKEIIDAGYNAAKAHASDLARFELSDEAWAAYVADRRSRMRPSERSGKILAVTSPKASFQKNAQAEIKRKLDSRVVAEHELEKALTGIVSATAVPGAAYGWQQGEDGKGGYTVKFAERPNDQLLARFSALYSISPGEPSRFGLKMSTVTVMKNSYKARFLGTLNLGYDPGVRVEPYKPFGGSQYFIAPQFFLERMHFNQYRGPERLSDTRDRFGGAFYAGVGTWQSAQVRIGAEAGYDSYSHSKVVDGVPSRSGGYASPALRWNFNTQDSGGMPTRGIQAEGAAGYTFRKTGEFPFLQHDFSSFFPVNRHFTLFAVNRAETSFGRKLGYFDQFMSGEQKSMSAFRYQAFHANTLVTAGPGVILHGPPIPYLSARPGLFFWYEAGRFDLGSSGWATHQSSSFGLIFPTQLGATAVQLSFDENGKARFRLSVGSF